MNKQVLLWLTVLVILFTGGCGGETGTAGADNTAAVAEAENLVVPEEAPDLIGRVKEIVGNEVTVYIAEMPAAANGGDGSGEELPAGNRQATTGTEAPPENRAPNAAIRMGFNVTEETETFLIPVGVPLAAVQRGGGAAAPMELADIKKDQFIRVWKKDDAIVFIQVMAMPGTRQDAAGSGQRPPDMGPPGAGGMGGPVIIMGGDR